MIDDIQTNLVLNFETKLNFCELNRIYSPLGDFHRNLGNTPLFEIPISTGGGKVLAKLEFKNPVGSIKDRVAYVLVCDAINKHRRQSKGELKILEYSGGNLSRAISFLAKQIGIKNRFVLSSGSPKSLLDELLSNDSQFILVEKSSGFLAVINEALKIARTEPSWTLLYQHRNQENVAFHSITTGKEIVEQLGERLPTAWVASIGTGGTLVGVAHALQKKYPNIVVFGVTPSELPYGSAEPPNGLAKFGGSGGLGNSICQPYVKAFKSPIRHMTVGYLEALQGMREFFKYTGMRIGSSAAANWIVARNVASQMHYSEHVVTVFPCAGTPEEWETVDRLSS